MGLVFYFDFDYPQVFMALLTDTKKGLKLPTEAKKSDVKNESLQ